MSCFHVHCSGIYETFGKYYTQCDGVAIGSPLGPTLANIFLRYWEDIWLNKCPIYYVLMYKCTNVLMYKCTNVQMY